MRARLRRVVTIVRAARRATDDAHTPAVPEAAPVEPAPFRPTPWSVADSPTVDGVNIVGYLDKQLGLGDAGREIATALLDHGVRSAPLAFGASPSPDVDPPFPSGSTIEHTNTLAVVTADQIPTLHEWHPEIFTASDRMIGYCFWELSQLSDAGRVGVELLDEVWAPTRFVQSVFERLDTVPVRHVPYPVAEPTPSTRVRASFEPLADVAADRVVFGATFDYWSVLERKNPIGAIDAFTRAFAPDDGPVLIVKTLNAASHPEEHARLVARAGERADVVIWDQHLSTPDQFAFLAGLDVLVSLHRGEGLGKHLAEAMWLGVPCIATGYSGNLDFMSDSDALLVGHSMIDVAGGGSIYPSGTQWADPDLDHAAEAMRKLASDADERRRLGAAARARMASAPDRAALAAIVRRHLDL